MYPQEFDIKSALMSNNLPRLVLSSFIQNSFVTFITWEFIRDSKAKQFKQKVIF